MSDANVWTMGVDLGTTTCKAVALALDGRVLASAEAALELTTGDGGAAEQDANMAVATALQVMRQLGTVPALARRRLAAIALSGAMHSIVPIESSEPIAPAMTWPDLRAVNHVESFRARLDPRTAYRTTGCPARLPYHGPRLLWWTEQLGKARAERVRFVSLKDVLTHRLSGKWVTDASMASTTGLMDLKAAQWWPDALAAAGVKAEQLCEIGMMTRLINGLQPAAARATGFLTGTPIVAGGSDGPLANIGSGAAMRGRDEAVVTVGTSGAVRVACDAPRFDDQERSWCYRCDDRRFIAGGAINNGGLALEWVRSRFYGDQTDGFTQMMRDADPVAPGADGVVFVPYLTGERSPWWSPLARASLHGLKLNHERGHVTRAAMESVAMCLSQVWDAVVTTDTKHAKLTGGVTRNPVWCRILADVLGVSLSAREGADASAIGAAMLAQAMVSLRVTGDWTIGTPAESEVVYHPDASRHAAYRSHCQRFKELSLHAAGVR